MVTKGKHALGKHSGVHFGELRAWSNTRSDKMAYLVAVGVAVAVAVPTAEGATGPRWPAAFSVSFNYTQLGGVPMSVGRISYDWTRRSERIDHTLCFCPHVGHDVPCTAFFLNDSFVMYAAARDHLCCLMQPFGPTAPTVFQDWTSNGTAVLDDAATGGRLINARQWDSPSAIEPVGFVYWTTDDAAQTGVRMHDGRDGSEYTFGAWDARAPDPAIFELPAAANRSQCFVPCAFA
jgi:hypothetical protein